MVLEIYDREAMGEVTPREIAIINRGLVEEFGEGGILAPAEIASILSDEDLPVRFDQIFNMSAPDDRYEHLFSAPLDISTLQSAESSLRHIQSIHEQLVRSQDLRGAQYARALARAAKDEALAQSTNSKLAELQRLRHAEIAQWFTIWLQTPALLDAWLELRKTTPAYREICRLHETALSD
ncbi:MAG: hypothetical protein ABI882_14010 [Acidobacteriota bacterium]